MARVGYGKIGRSYNLDPAKATSIGGDIDVLNLLVRLAKAHPEHEFVLVGKNSGEDPSVFGYPSNVINPWTEWRKGWKAPTDSKNADEAIEQFRRVTGELHKTLDHLIVWAGQHGSANSRIPMIGSNWITRPGADDDDVITGGVGENLATPQYSFINYCSGLLDFISRWREAGPGPTQREEIWLCPDPRNYLKCREKRWPIRYPVLAQYDFLRYHKGERFGRFPPELATYDPTGYRENSLWVSNVAYCYSALELTAVGDPTTIPFDPRPGAHKFGVVMNENLTNVKDSRLALLKGWILPNFPDAELRGHWTEGSQIELGRVIEPVPYPEVAGVMKSFATTLTTPASGSGWATAKPWEAFALGSVCFFHPRYDDQGWIIPTEKNAHEPHWSEDAKMLSSYLRVKNAEQLVQRVNEVTANQDLYHSIVTAQRRHYEASFAKFKGGALAVSDRIDWAEGQIVEGAPWLELTRPIAAKVAARAAARPRGTNEERKKKPPISRRRPLRGGVASLVDEPQPEKETPVEEDTGHVALDVDDKTADHCKTRFDQSLRAFHHVPPATLAFTGPFTGLSWSSNALTVEVLSPEPALAPLLSRQSKDEYFLAMAEHVATRSTCARRSVGCVLVSTSGVVLATGYNGVPRGFPHCNEGHECPGAHSLSGTNMSQCLSPHAESNAWLQCNRIDDVETIYVTTSCCVECTKMALNSSATRIVFREEYIAQPEAKELWLRHGEREWIKL